MSGGDDVPPNTAALIRLGAEVSEIRRELVAIREALVDDDGDGDDGDAQSTTSWECRCGETVASDTAARAHVVAEHEAPADYYQDIMTRHDTDETNGGIND